MDPGPPVVIAIASTMEERLRLAALVTGHAAVLLVGSREEALALLGQPPGSPPYAPPDPVPAMVPAERCHVLEPLPTDVQEAARAVVAVDSDRRVASWRGRSVPLSPLEHDVLRCLLTDVGRTWTFERLHRRVWGNEHLGGRADVQSVVKRLRRKLSALSSPLRIQAVRGVGLRLVDHREPVVLARPAE